MKSERMALASGLQKWAEVEGLAVVAGEADAFLANCQKVAIFEQFIMRGISDVRMHHGDPGLGLVGEGLVMWVDARSPTDKQCLQIARALGKSFTYLVTSDKPPACRRLAPHLWRKIEDFCKEFAKFWLEQVSLDDIVLLDRALRFPEFLKKKKEKEKKR